MATRYRESVELDVADVYRRLMDDLASGHSPSLLSAFRSAILSVRMNSESNQFYAHYTNTHYRNVPLPVDRAQFKQDLLNSGRACEPVAYGLMQPHVDTLYAFDEVWFGLAEAERDALFDFGADFDSQAKWRVRVVAACKGVGYKVASWALTIYCPVSCQLLTVDCIHAARLGIDPLTLRDPRVYLEAERCLRGEARERFTGYPDWVSASVGWFESRGGYTSHAGINCREQEAPPDPWYHPPYDDFAEVDDRA